MTNWRRHSVRSYRSGLESVNAEFLENHGVAYEYEKLRIPFEQPAKPRTYTPDYVLLKNGIIVETKGEFNATDRQKHLLIKEQHPDLDIRFVFSNPNSRIYKGSKTTHGMWAEQHGFIYAAKLIPTVWLTEPPNYQSLTAIEALRRLKK